MTRNKHIEIYCDGGARGNPGLAAVAFVVFGINGETIFKKSKFIGFTTNNVAEYRAVEQGLSWLVKKMKGYTDCTIFLDSELATKQLKGIYKVKSENLKPLYVKVKKLEQQYEGKITYQRVPREKNKLADFLVNKELDKKV